MIRIAMAVPLDLVISRSATTSVLLIKIEIAEKRALAGRQVAAMIGIEVAATVRMTVATQIAVAQSGTNL
nr:hypothetical protein [Corynebacterium mustelae]